MSEDPFYCGNLNQAEETSATSVLIEEKKKIWRIKTRQEFVDTLGPDWTSYARNSEGCWNSRGKMEWLLGKPLHEVINSKEDREIWNRMPATSRGLIREETTFYVINHEGADDDDPEGPWTIWPYYDVVYDYPV